MRLPRLFLATVLLLAPVATFAADAPALDKEVLKKAKAATAFLRVTLSDGRVAQGSGFLTDSSGLVLTNSHVLNMLDPESRAPTKIEVVFDGGGEKSRTLTAKVVGVDRGSDLALVRLDGKDFPPPLKFGDLKGLTETDVVYVFGYPFGEQLGKEISVSKSSVSSLRKVGDTVMSIQLDGGLNPGNSGGPVIDKTGKVIGVAVSGIRGTGIGNAIPAEFVSRFQNGRIVASGSDVPYKSGDKLMMEVTFELVDPLGRLKNIELQLWAGSPAAPRPPATKEPPPVAGDSPKKRFKLTYDKKGTATTAVTLPKLTDRQVYWIQPIITAADGEPRWAAATVIPPKPALERREITLKYKPPLNGKQTSELVSNGDFRIRTGDGEVSSIGLDMVATFTETFGADAGKSIPMELAYDGFGLTINANNKPVEKDAEMRKTQTDIRFATALLDMDKNGSVLAARADLRRVPRESREALAELSDQILESFDVLSIPLPAKKLAALDTWKAQPTFLIGSAVFSVPVQTDVTYKYMGVQTRDGKEGALVRIDGVVRGRKGDGLDVGGRVSGTAFVSVETGQVITADTTVKADMDITIRKKEAKAVATLGVSIRRPAPPVK